MFLRADTRRKEAGHTYAIVAILLSEPGREVIPATFTFALRKDKLRIVRPREGSYLLRSNLTGGDPSALWRN